MILISVSTISYFINYLLLDYSILKRNLYFKSVYFNIFNEDKINAFT